MEGKDHDSSMFVKQRDGDSLRPTWYGFFKQDGKAAAFNTGVPWKGVPPASLRIGDVCLLKWDDVDLRDDGWIKVLAANIGDRR